MSETYYVESKKDERELISHISDFSVSLRRVSIKWDSNS